MNLQDLVPGRFERASRAESSWDLVLEGVVAAANRDRCQREVAKLVRGLLSEHVHPDHPIWTP
eukprot:259659-Rhodomonas_salina.1